MNFILKLIMMIAIGIGMVYGYSVLILSMQHSQEEELAKYCPGWLEDHSKPCGLTGDTPLPMFLALGMIVYALVFMSLFIDNPSPKQEKL